MKARITWEQHGDFLLMLSNGWKRGVIYYEGGWWTVGILDVPAKSTQLKFFKNKAEAKKSLRKDYDIWSNA